MSEWILTSSALIVCILLLRRLLRGRVSMKTVYGMWLFVALRLLLPFTFLESQFSVPSLMQHGRAWIGRAGESFFDADLLPYRGQENEAPQSDRSDIALDFGRRTTSSVYDASGWEADSGSGVDSGQQPGEVSWIKPGTGKDNSRDFAEEPDGAYHRISKLLGWIWLSGAALCAGVVVFANLWFYRRLRCSRSRMRRLRTGCGLPVYVSEAVCTPCLFGPVHPAIYLTFLAARDEKAIRHILLHECMHYRHRDHIWALVRLLCLCVHWYNPLVWLAASYSKHDCELACDEAVLRGRREEERIDYGRTLLSYAAFGSEGGFSGRLQCSTGISSGKRQLKERILLVALQSEARHRTWAAVLPALLATFIAFLGGVEAEAVMDDEWEGLGEAEAFLPENMMRKDMLPYGFQNAPVTADLNFDGYEDFCMPVEWEGDEELYYCYLWNPGKERFEQKGMIPGLQVETETRLLVNRKTDEWGRSYARYYRFDEEGSLHLVRYVEEDFTDEAVFSHLELTCCELSYSIPLVYHRELAEEEEQTEKYIYWAKQALTELYEWSGTKVDTVCFAVTEYGDFYFGGSSSDVRASRIFYSRCYGSRAGFLDCIENMNLSTERVAWYSDVTQWRVPEHLKSMTDQEVAAWYFDRSALAKGEIRKSIEASYENAYVVRTESDQYYELSLNPVTREVSSVYGPYDSYPIH